MILNLEICRADINHLGNSSFVHIAPSKFFLYFAMKNPNLSSEAQEILFSRSISVPISDICYLSDTLDRSTFEK